jgi:hypothetical protein
MTSTAYGQSFHLGDVLSVTTGRLVSPEHIGGIYKILGFMCGEDLFTHQLPRAAEECKPELLRQHPDLAAVEVPDEFHNATHVHSWLAEQVAKYGETRVVQPLAAEDHTSIDPIAELRMIAPHAEILVINPSADGAS